jgi:RPA family protein
MKIKYIIPAFIAVVAAVFTGCSENTDPTYLAEIQVSQSYVSIPANGGTVSVDLTASSSWSVKEDASYSKWLTITPAQGSAGNTTITFSAPAASASNSALVEILCEGKTQEINVIQLTEKAEVPISTCAQIVAGEDGKTYRAKGACKAIANTTYGNWYLDDGTEEVYIYGTLDAKGAEKNFLSLGIEVGDIVTVEGPKTTYNGTVELVNVTVINIEKSLIKVDSLMVDGVKGDELPVEGGEFEARITNKGNGISVVVPEDAKSWLSITGIESSGTNAVVKFLAAANAAGVRETTLTFKTTDGKKDYSSTATIKQKGSIVACSVAEFLAAPVGPALFKITGVVADLYPSDKNGESFYIQDYSGKTLVYRAAGFKASGAKVGDVVTVVGQRGAYKDSPQMVSGTFEKIEYAVTQVTIEEFLAKPDSKDDYYMVTGTISSLKSSDGKDNDYGNLYITDGTNELYVYGCYPGWGATGDARKFFIAENGIQVGDELTMIGYKSTYKGLIELCGGTCFSFKHAE